VDLKTRRIAAGLTAEQMGRLARCSTSTVRLTENGWRPRKSHALRRIEAVLQALERAADAERTETDGDAVA
jgi:transcriptional regulator with XRE-family HTH domain